MLIFGKKIPSKTAEIRLESRFGSRKKRDGIFRRGGGFESVLGRLGLTAFFSTPITRSNLAQGMGEWFLMLAMLLVAMGHVLLIKKCASLESEIPNQTSGLKSMMGEVRDLLDEALDLLADAPAGPALPAQMGQAESIPNLLLSTLISRMSMAPADGSTTQPQEWEVYPPNEQTPEPVQGPEHHQHG